MTPKEEMRQNIGFVHPMLGGQSLLVSHVVMIIIGFFQMLDAGGWGAVAILLFLAGKWTHASQTPSQAKLCVALKRFSDFTARTIPCAHKQLNLTDAKQLNTYAPTAPKP